MKRTSIFWTMVLTLCVGLMFSACSPQSTSPGKEKPAVLEAIEGTDLNKVILTEKAAERLGIQTTSVREEQVMRVRTLVGEVIMPEMVAVTSGDTAASSGALVRVRLTASDQSGIDTAQPALVKSLDDEEDSDLGEIEADWVDSSDVGDIEESSSTELMLYYMLGADHKLTPGQYVRVEVPMAGQQMGKAQKIIPYSAVLYDLEGNTWIYINPEPLSYIRQPITIDYIDDDEVILLDGPAADTAVVTVGVPELYGIDTGIGK